jgi:superoxide dismutase
MDIGNMYDNWRVTQSAETASNFHVPDSYFDSTRKKFERQSAKHKSHKTIWRRTAPKAYHSQESQRIEHDLNEKLGS